MGHEINCLSAALEYAGIGLKVLPVWAKTKRPCIRSWQKRATSDSERIRSWWGEFPDASVGILTGRRSNAVVLDIDPRNGGNETLEKLEAAHGSLPDTVEALTGGRGRHLYFVCPGQLKKGTLADGIDFQAEGAYVVAPPSFHESGNCYQWKPGHAPTECELAELPSWVIELHTNKVGASRVTRKNNEKEISTIPIQEWSPRSETEPYFVVPEGHRNVTLTSCGGALRSAGCEEEMIRTLLLIYNKSYSDPSLPTDEVVGIASSIASYPPGTKTEKAIRMIFSVGFPCRRVVDRAVLLVLVHYCNWKTWTCYPTDEQIAERIGYKSTDPILKARHRLQGAKFLAWEKTSAHSEFPKNVYTVDIDRLVQMHDDAWSGQCVR